MLPHDALHRLDAFHLWHGDVHEHDVRLRAVEFRDSCQAIAGFTGHFPAEHLDHLDDVFASEYRVVHYQVADRLVVFANQRRELLHGLLLHSLQPCQLRWEETGVLSFLSFSIFSCRSFLSLSILSAAARSPWYWLTRKAPMLSSGTILLTCPLTIAARGIPLTTQLSSL